jgi:hypothetical protein
MLLQGIFELQLGFCTLEVARAEPNPARRLVKITKRKKIN